MFLYTPIYNDLAIEMRFNPVPYPMTQHHFEPRVENSEPIHGFQATFVFEPSYIPDYKDGGRYGDLPVSPAYKDGGIYYELTPKRKTVLDWFLGR